MARIHNRVVVVFWISILTLLLLWVVDLINREKKIKQIQASQEKSDFLNREQKVKKAEKEISEFIRELYKYKPGKDWEKKGKEYKLKIKNLLKKYQSLRDASRKMAGLFEAMKSVIPYLDNPFGGHEVPIRIKLEEYKIEDILKD